jgi:cell division protein FtsI (penicillin-binding protein 3)
MALTTRTRATQPPAGSPSELRLYRSWLMAIALVLPLVLSLAGFASLQRGAPMWPKPLVEAPHRGAVLAADGTVLAEGPAEVRYYPQGTLAAGLLGFTGAVQPDGRYGLEGLEYTLDARLQSGDTVRLTIDPTLQAAAESQLAASIRANEAQTGSAVIIEVGTGRVLAAASYPTYDPNTWSTSSREAMVNRPFLYQYEPGSVMKPFVVAGLLESGRLRPDEMLDTPMHLRVGTKTFRDVVQHDPVLNVSDILRFSSNTGTIEMAKRFTSAELHAWVGAFGFGQEMPLRSTFTRPGLLNAWDRWVPQDHASVSIGQSVSTTALQLAAAYTVFANDGWYVPPRLVEDEAVPPPHQVLSPEVAMTIRHMLTYTVEASGLRASRIPGVATAGKTGTADIFDTTRGSYTPGDYVVSFAGMFPADQPTVVMVVYVDRPRVSTSSTLVAAPLFRAIGSEVVAHWGLAPGERVVADRE